MNDIFISYKREERAVARRLADALEAEGWTVWWDPKLRAGDYYDDVIERALNDAKCVIVLWSRLSIESDYVKAEAAQALEQQKLLPVMLESVTLPFRYKRLHARVLSGWTGSREAVQFLDLLEDVAGIVGSRPAVAVAPAPQRAELVKPPPQATKSASARFVMPIDDVFPISGRGVVVTGIVSEGSCAVGDTVVIVKPDDTEVHRATVTGIEMFRKMVDRAEQGDNVGILMKDVSKLEAVPGLALIRRA